MASDEENKELLDLYLQLKKEIDRENDLIPLRLYSPTTSNITPDRVEKILIELGRLRNKKAVPLLIKKLKDPDEKIRIIIIKSLGKIKDKRAIDPLLSLLDGNYHYKFINHTIESLGRIVTGEIDEKDLVYPNYKTTTTLWKVRERSKKEASTIPGKTIKKVKKALRIFLNDKRVRVRKNAAFWLGKIGDENDLIALENLLEDESRIVRSTAAKVLNKSIDFYKKVFIPYIQPIITFNLYKKDPNLYEYSIDGKNIEVYKMEIQLFICNKLNSLSSEDKLRYKNWLNNILKGNYGNNKHIKDFAPLYVASLEYLLLTNEIDLNRLKSRFNEISTFYCDIDIEYLHDVNKIQITRSLNFGGTSTPTSHLRSKLDSLVVNPDEKEVNGENLFDFDVNYVLTEFGKKNKKEIAKITDSLLEEFKAKYRKTLFQYILPNKSEMTSSELNKYKIFFPEKEDFIEFKKKYEKRIRRYYVSNYEEEGKILIGVEIFQIAVEEISRILRKSENLYRVKIGAPKVGEGWISETELYYKIKNAFPKEKVVFHGKPSWLGQQHLDIYFPKKNIAVEYQGIQHNKPVDFFGGEESFNYRKSLDQMKLKKCKENGCKLIYVYPDYNFDSVKETIEKILKS